MAVPQEYHQSYSRLNRRSLTLKEALQGTLVGLAVLGIFYILIVEMFILSGPK